jgi:hypothetical protein
VLPLGGGGHRAKPPPALGAATARVARDSHAPEVPPGARSTKREGQASPARRGALRRLDAADHAGSPEAPKGWTNFSRAEVGQISRALKHVLPQGGAAGAGVSMVDPASSRQNPSAEAVAYCARTGGEPSLGPTVRVLGRPAACWPLWRTRRRQRLFPATSTSSWGALEACGGAVREDLGSASERAARPGSGEPCSAERSDARPGLASRALDSANRGGRLRQRPREWYYTFARAPG